MKAESFTPLGDAGNLQSRTGGLLAAATILVSGMTGTQFIEAGVAQADCCNERSHIAFDYFRRDDYTPVQAAALEGNLSQESDTDPSASGGGIAQWQGLRWDNLQTFAQRRPRKYMPTNNLHLQLRFISHELNGAYSTVRQELHATHDLATATEEVCHDYEIAGTCGDDNRLVYARMALAHYGHDLPSVHHTKPRAKAIRPNQNNNVTPANGEVMHQASRDYTDLSDMTLKLSATLGNFTGQPYSVLAI